MHRASLVICLVGCMKIYPDPELPDVRVDWFADQNCKAPDDIVGVTLRAAASEPVTREASAPCTDSELSLVDVARERYIVALTLYDAVGAPRGNRFGDIDLRDGTSERISVFFGDEVSSFVHADLAFAMGATCASLPAVLLELELGPPGEPPAFTLALPCDEPTITAGVPITGPTVATARARNGEAVVAVSPTVGPFDVTVNQLTDLGTLVLSPCGASCPPVDPP